MLMVSGEEKAALLLKGLATDLAEAVLGRLGGERGNRVRQRMQRFNEVPAVPEALDQTLREFEILQRAAPRETTSPLRIFTEPAANESKPSLRNSEEAKREKPPSGPPELKIVRPTPEVPEVENTADVLLILRKLDLDQLATALKGEHTRTVTMILDYFEADRAGELLKRLTPEMRREVSVQLGKSTGGGPALLQRVARALIQKCRNMKESPAAASPDVRVKKIAEMLRLLEKKDRMEVLTALEESDPDTAVLVKDQLYQFEDLLLIEDRSMQKLLAEIDSKNLATALKGASEEIKDKVMNNLSKRARETLSEEMVFLGSVPSSQIQQAEKMVVAAIQRLDQAGELVMKE